VTSVVSVEPRIVEQEAILLMDGHALSVERVVDHEPPHAEVERRLSEDHVVAVATTLVVIALHPEVLNAHLFESIAELQTLTRQWLRVYNQERPHDSLGRVPPLTFLPRPTTAGQSPWELSA
jgi:transposase InsO family protein